MTRPRRLLETMGLSMRIYLVVFIVMAILMLIAAGGLVMHMLAATT